LIEIKDTGYGIPKEKRSTILADSVNSKDMSFSLYLVQLILEKLKANINFKSEENKGTTFSISLPI
jgi:sensor histidine kinase regulating citrate/malate metabolism